MSTFVLCTEDKWTPKKQQNWLQSPAPVVRKHKVRSCHSDGFLFTCQQLSSCPVEPAQSRALPPVSPLCLPFLSETSPLDRL